MSVDAPAAPALALLVERLAAHPSFQEVVAALRSGRSGTLDGVWGSSCALAAAALHASAPSCLVVVAPHHADAEGVASDLAAFTSATPRAFGAVAPSFGEGAGYDADAAGRLRVLRELVDGVPPRLIVAPIAGLLQKTPHPETIAANRRTFRVGDRAEPEDVAAALVELSFSATTAVEAPGEFSLRGGILDVFAADADEPLRIEFFGDEIASLRRFSVATQRSSEVVDSAQILAVTAAVGAGATLFDFLPPDAWLMLIEPQAAEEEAKHVIRTAPEKESILGYDVAWRRLCEHPSVTASSVAVGSMETTCRIPIETVERFSGDLQKVRDELDAVGGGQRVCIMCESDGEAERLGEVFSSTTLAAERRLELHVAPIRSGFRFVSEQIAVLSAAEMFHRDARRGTAGRRLGRAIDSFVDLRAGDLVVHVGHGVARYLGMKLLDKGGQVEEHLELEFAGGVKLFVPATSISLVQKYVGGSKARPKLAKLGGAAWGRHKKAAADAVADMAADLLELQARRTSASGIAFSTDSSWQDDFDALFPFDLTADQAAAVEATRADMQTARPMDRLICGDVGFGKTEVAMRAAFRAVDSGYQVAVLAPTTILVEQHYRTFSQRMAEFPFTVAALSRFSSRKQQKQVVESAATGGVDIVIGTHRLVQSDVRFRNLGLIIIDEEQRFGVEVKERLKAIRAAVDVLTLTATPIPRTLHMSLLGIRDISNLETAPEGRMPIETKVCRFDRDLIRHAALRELQRGGQIYFVHNRIHDIGEVQARLEQILPEARIAVAHGQMPEGELEEIVLGFVAGKFDLLLATTIVESGLDIPNANTMFINEADRYGLAEMHQLRGRVGRSTHRAFCYLLIDENKHLNPEAAKRLRAIEEFHAIGAGFAIAMRDLEIRGAGNILGSEQSGHISAVGYELYCTLLEQAVRRLKQLPEPPIAEAFIDLPGEAYLPRSYVPDLRQKVDLYRRLSRVGSHDELGELLQEMEDRFGPPPAPVRRLQMLAELRITVAGWGVRGLRLEEQFVVFEYRRADLIQRLKQELRGALRIVDDESAYLPLKQIALEGSDVATALKSLLPPAPPAP